MSDTIGDCCRRSLIRGPVPLMWTGALIRGLTWDIKPPKVCGVGPRFRVRSRADSDSMGDPSSEAGHDGIGGCGGDSVRAQVARLSCQAANPLPCLPSGADAASAPYSWASVSRSVDASLKQRHAALRSVSKHVIACLTNSPTRADADAAKRTERLEHLREFWIFWTCKLFVGNFVSSVRAYPISMLLRYPIGFV
jgi:hypothetical protein